MKHFIVVGTAGYPEVVSETYQTFSLHEFCHHNGVELGEENELRAEIICNLANSVGISGWFMEQIKATIRTHLFDLIQSLRAKGLELNPPVNLMKKQETFTIQNPTRMNFK